MIASDFKCEMGLQKFPFDEQTCSAFFDMYDNTADQVGNAVFSALCTKLCWNWTVLANCPEKKQAQRLQKPCRGIT